MTVSNTPDATDALIEQLGLRSLLDKAIEGHLYLVWGGDTAICFFPHELIYQMQQGRFRHGPRAWTLGDPKAELTGIDRRITELAEEKVKLQARMDKELDFSGRRAGV